MPEKTKQSQKKPNILIIWGDDIGWSNVSAYNLGIMGSAHTPQMPQPEVLRQV